ncbi:MAG: helix-turn-helix domain-containing protein [Bacteroidales bacterium]|nr:helix-turn-helix domain-containing protein [Bacteroidales bacterium]
MNERDRIEMLMRCYNLSPSQFATKTGIQKASVSHILSGRNKPSLEVMLKIYDAFPGVDIKWLMTGDGEEPVAPAGDTMLSLSAAKEEPEPAGVRNIAPVATGGDSLFPATDFVVSEITPSKPVAAPRQPVVVKSTSERQYKRNAPVRSAAGQQQAPQRKIKEIRVFYTDGTYETMFPEK